MNGHDALARAEMVCRNGGSFGLSFYTCSLAKGRASTDLTTYEGCTVRTQLPHEKWSVDGKNLFLFTSSDGKPRMCWKILIRYMVFSDQKDKLYKIRLYE